MSLEEEEKEKVEKFLDPLESVSSSSVPSGVDLLGGSLPVPVAASSSTSSASGSRIGLDLLEDIFAPEPEAGSQAASVLRPQQAPTLPSVPLKPNPVLAPKPTSTSVNHNNVSKNGSSAQVAPKAPHYSRSFFTEAEQSKKETAKVVEENHFQDLLQGFKGSSSNEAKTMGQLKKQEMVSLM